MEYSLMRQRDIVRRGFTLVEFLLYIGISSLILLAASAFLSLSLSLRTRTAAVAEVEQQGFLIAEVITQAVRNAGGIDSPVLGGVSGALTISGASAVTFDVVDGVLRMSEGGGAPVPLTGRTVQVSALAVEHLDRESVRMQFVVSSVNTTGLDMLDYSQRFFIAATVRTP